MSYLVDTDVVANALKGRPEETTLLTNLSPQGLAISLITYGEIYDGIYYGRDPPNKRADFPAVPALGGCTPFESNSHEAVCPRSGTPATLWPNHP